MDLRLHIIIIFSSFLAAVYPQEVCKETYEPSRCIYNIDCLNYFVVRNHDYYRRDYHIGMDFQPDHICDDSVNYQGDSNWDPIYLNFKDTGIYLDVPDTIPRTHSDREMFSKIVSLNLSHNEYNYSPDLQDMANLAALDISNNHLTTAKLYNVLELPSLTKVDLSHNTISDIEVLSDQQAYRKLKTIILSYNYLVNIPETIFDVFEDLESLDLSHNFIDTLTPLTFEGIKHLLYLNMSNNRISDINSSLFRFNELKVLQLSSNNMKCLRARDFEKLKKLETLDFSSNSISSIEINVFQNMPLLYNLDLSNNMLESIDKETFSNVTNLRLINLSVNNLKVLSLGLFKGKRISLFSIKGNSLDGSLLRGTFDGLKFVTELDLGNQQLSSIDSFAFFGLETLDTLLLNNNHIQSLAMQCFRSLSYLQKLDLSNNKITSIEFDKEDLHSLQSLSIKNNYLTQVNYEHFQGISSLQFLGLSNNNISHLEPDSFKSLRELINFEISNNPLSDNLEKNTFDGLSSLPSLDISRTSLSSIQNSSFSDMLQLRNLNISHSKLKQLEYNIFSRTGALGIVDLSYNQLEEFYINTTELANLRTLFLNNNLIKAVYSSSLIGMPRLNSLIISQNNIETVHDEAFKEQRDLHYLDMSYNSNLKFNVSIVKMSKNLNSLYLSGIGAGVSFKNVGDSSLSELEISHSGITDIKALELKELKHLDHLVLSYNDIVKLEVGAFSNISSLRNLDLSFNKITFIQPGAFKDNTLLYTLNISHNCLTAITYGIFRGLIYLHTLDMSYNYISSLQSERFYEVTSLSVLIVDHNRIESINSEEFTGTSLTKLSIGENPLHCEILVKLEKNSVPFEVTAIRLDDKSDDENVHGVTCNMKKHSIHTKQTSELAGQDEKVLADIRDILFNYSNIINKTQNTVVIQNNGSKYLENITNQIEKSVAGNNDKLSEVVIENNNTNALLEKILKVLTDGSVRKTTPIPITKDNATYENLLPYINKFKMDIEDDMAEKQNIISDLKKKISQINSRIDSMSVTDIPKHEKLLANDVPLDSKSLFTETCVALILLILVGFVLFKFYKSRMYIRNRFSVSTRELPSAMDNSTL